MNAPVEIGQQVFVAHAYSHAKVWAPCPVCYGKLAVTLELGNGERVSIQCDACGLGFEGPQGRVREYRAASGVRAAVVDGVQVQNNGWRIIVAHAGSEIWGETVFATEAEAEARRVVMHAEVEKDAEHRCMQQREYKRKKPTWLVRYHREQIKRAEKDLAWHRAKLPEATARLRTTGEQLAERIRDA